MASYLPNQLYQVPLAELQPDPAQPHKYQEVSILLEINIRHINTIDADSI